MTVTDAAAEQTADAVAAALEVDHVESHLHPVSSFDLDDHPMPTGREEIWRFTPLARLAGALDDAPTDDRGDDLAATYETRGPAEYFPGTLAIGQAPIGEREGAYALGATRLGMISTVVLPFGRGGIIGGTMLGLGRALGETIAVYMIMSPIFTINWQVLKSGTNSVSALIALNYGEASDFGLSALMAAGLALFLLTLVINFTASSIVARSRSGAQSDD